MAKDCRVAIRGIDDYDEEEAISRACMTDSEFNDLSVAGEWEATRDDKSKAGQGKAKKGIDEMTLEELENAILEIRTRDSPPWRAQEDTGFDSC